MLIRSCSWQFSVRAISVAQETLSLQRRRHTSMWLQEKHSPAKNSLRLGQWCTVLQDPLIFTNTGFLRSAACRAGPHRSWDKFVLCTSIYLLHLPPASLSCLTELHSGFMHQSFMNCLHAGRFTFTQPASSLSPLAFFLAHIPEKTTNPWSSCRHIRLLHSLCKFRLRV